MSWCACSTVANYCDISSVNCISLVHDCIMFLRLQWMMSYKPCLHYPPPPPLYHRPSQNTHTHTQSPPFAETNTKTQRFTLPLFGHLGRAQSATQVNTLPRNFHSHSHSFSNPSSMTDLSISPPLSPSDLLRPPQPPSYMPEANRRQRRASLVSWVVLPLASRHLR